MVETISQESIIKGLSSLDAHITQLLEEADKLFSLKMYRACFLTLYTAFEETGKGLFLLENTGTSITEKKWKEITRHRGAHLSKLLQSEKASSKSLSEDMFKFSNEKMPDDLIILPDADYTDNLTKERSSILYLDFDFQTDTWKSQPSDGEMGANCVFMSTHLISAHQAFKEGLKKSGIEKV